MPTTWHLHLRAERPVERQVTPAQLHGLACALLEGLGADHHGQTKPFSVTPLMQAPHAPGHALLTLGWLDDRTVPPLQKRAGEQVRLGGQLFTIEDIHAQGAPYAALLALPRAERVSMDFLSVTHFTRKGRWIPLPDPELLYTGLARRWNAYAETPLPPPLITELRETVLLTAHDVKSAPVDIGQAHRIGFLGHATFTLPRTARPEVASAFTALSHFAELAGTGAQTTHGLGWTTISVPPPHTRKTDGKAAGRSRNRPPRREPSEADSRASQTRRSQPRRQIL
ncbi:CRISPR system precrRNA processing endoribonuclease RAMP protein Cas6 [Streptomyces sp. P9(2023)]|uniref:CRISPR system precrRNA processing endoribonuclease RAMP protein Cas6 n=1 Tax=Streptomyces sp. P9(2023) TaxID=3064394 RepID=UPI0028F4378C|nr:CRISPR system precrRNA processing endoribonuclease RAMP protein Cas6 [Streptomyces sp. P9(2023)]MDT9692643.1 CRISPR system precrRNA processing endoribonuclease RAMP protein Cas6 [Streptomyces sp. P9(2023)]